MHTYIYSASTCSSAQGRGGSTISVCLYICPHMYTCKQIYTYDTSGGVGVTFIHVDTNPHIHTQKYICIHIHTHIYFEELLAVCPPLSAVKGAAASLLPVCECLLPGGELDLRPAGPGRSDTLPVARVSQRRQSSLFNTWHHNQNSCIDYVQPPPLPPPPSPTCSDRAVPHAVLARVLINDSLFVLCAVSLAVCIFKIAKMSSANVYLESKVGRRGGGEGDVEGV